MFLKYAENSSHHMEPKVSLLYSVSSTVFILQRIKEDHIFKPHFYDMFSNIFPSTLRPSKLYPTFTLFSAKFCKQFSFLQVSAALPF
jgi:hypothetical protein